MKINKKHAKVLLDIMKSNKAHEYLDNVNVIIDSEQVMLIVANSYIINRIVIPKEQLMSYDVNNLEYGHYLITYNTLKTWHAFANTKDNLISDLHTMLEKIVEVSERNIKFLINDLVKIIDDNSTMENKDITNAFDVKLFKMATSIFTNDKYFRITLGENNKPTYIQGIETSKHIDAVILPVKIERYWLKN